MKTIILSVVAFVISAAASFSATHRPVQDSPAIVRTVEAPRLPCVALAPIARPVLLPEMTVYGSVPSAARHHARKARREYVCRWETMQMGTIGDHVQYCQWQDRS